MNNPELPLDPNLQTSNLLITFLKYASIVMQDTKGKPSCPPSLWLWHSASRFSSVTSQSSLYWGAPISLSLTPLQAYFIFLIFVFPDEHRLNSARLCLIILTCIAEVWAAHPSTSSNNLTVFDIVSDPNVDLIQIFRTSMLMPFFMMTIWTSESICTEWWVTRHASIKKSVCYCPVYYFLLKLILASIGSMLIHWSITLSSVMSVFSYIVHT